MINSPEEKIKQMEKKVNELVEESCFANDRGEYPLVSQMHFQDTCICSQHFELKFSEIIFYIFYSAPLSKYVM